MAAETITLTGDAVTGLVTSPGHRLAVAGLPQTVRLGRRAPKARPQALRLEAYEDYLATVPIPDSCDWYTKAAVAVARMYKNDQLGCCVISGKAHNLGVWSANDPDSTPDGSTVLCTDQEIVDQYHAVCGPGDNGCVITDVLDYMRTKGFTAGGKKYKIKGYVSVDPRNKDAVRAGLYLFGAATIGINLPQAWTSNAVWDVTTTRVVGGHDVSPAGYGKPAVISTTKEGVVILSWGRLYLITWEAFTSGKWVDEMYFMVPETLWTGTDGKNPKGVDLSVLLDDLAKFGGGTIPPLPDPTPTPPPVVPPTPPSPPAPVPPTPPLPVVLYGTGTTAPQTIQVPGMWGQKNNVTIPGQTFPVVVSSGAGEGVGAVPPGLIALILTLLSKGGPIVADVLTILEAYKSGDRQAVIDALEKLAVDLGIPPLTVH